jgi:hypothetical protein
MTVLFYGGVPKDLTSESGTVTMVVSMTYLFYGGVPRDLVVVSMTVLFYGGVPIGT